LAFKVIQGYWIRR